MNFGTEYKPEKDKYLIKVVVIGDISVGKTNIIRRILDKGFEDTEATIGVEFGYLTINNIDNFNPNIKLCIQIWDTSGAERYRAITTSHIRKADGAFIVYDVCNEDSFEHIKFWYDCIKNATEEDITIFLLGNKTDLIPTEGRGVTKVEGQKFVRDNNLSGFSECSAKKNENIIDTFKLFYQTIYEKQKTKLEQKTIEREEQTKLQMAAKNQKKCCDF